MTAILFIPTGEVRPPKHNEHYVPEHATDSIYCCRSDMGVPRAILTRHEIEIPEGAELLNMFFLLNTKGNLGSQQIVLPRPKKRIRQYNVLLRDRTNGQYTLSCNQYTSVDDARMKCHPDYEIVSLIEETMTEVEL